MKKWWLGLFLISVVSNAFAAITDSDVIQEKTFVVHFTTTVPAATTAEFDLISLSTTTGLFPHSENGEIDISHININVDKVLASTTSVKVGVLNFVNSSTGSASFFFTYSALKDVNSSAMPYPANFSPAFYRCRVVSGATSTNTDRDGLTPYILTNDKRQGSALYKTGTALNGPIGAVLPKPGDIIFEIINGDVTNTINIVVDVWYHSEK